VLAGGFSEIQRTGVRASAVLDFRRHSNVPNYLGSQQQRRWLLLFALAGVAAIIVFRSGGSLPISWLAPHGGDDGLNVTHVPPEREAEPGDKGPGAQTGPPIPSDRSAFFPGVRKDYLSEVRDDQVFRKAESDAWFHLLALLENTPQRELQAASVGRVGFLQLDQQADWYRGRLVTTGGVVRSARLVDAPDNDFGIKQYYQLWVQPQQDSPKLIVVYCLHLPPGFPLGESLDATGQTTGFFFKRWAYQSHEGVTTAPLVLAGTIDWQPPPATPPPKAPAGEQMLLALAGALVLAVLIVGYFVARTRGGSRPRHLPDPGEVEAAMQAREGPLPLERLAGGAGDEAAGD
jgi:hypothetical protein